MKACQFIRKTIYLTAVSALVGCYDLNDLSKNPYELPDNSSQSKEINVEKDNSKYADINIDFAVSANDSVNLKSKLADAPAIFRNFLYEGYRSPRTYRTTSMQALWLIINPNTLERHQITIMEMAGLEHVGATFTRIVQANIETFCVLLNSTSTQNVIKICSTSLASTMLS